MNRSSCQGLNTMELMLAIAVVSIGLMVMIQQLSIGYREADCNEQRAFAFQKAAGMLQEIQNGIDQGRLKTATELYAMVDSTENLVLTTRCDEEGLALAPDHAMSGNLQRQGSWVWSRKISLEAHVQPGLYYAKVDVFSRNDAGGWTFQANQSQLVSLIPDADAPTQVFDVYVLALASAPSLWGDLSELRSELVNAQKALEQDSRARFRLHWITKLGYGRDPCAAPYVNTRTPATDAAPYAYWLPGLLGDGQPRKQLYRADLLGALHLTEAGLQGGWDPKVNTLPVTVASQWNHCMRSKAARKLFDERVAAGLEKADEPPLQLLFDLMHEQPERFRGALFVNLHGMAMPMPPLRNYSDAARDPTGHPSVRVVTHAARLQTPRDPDGNGNPDDSEDLELRVYAWKTDPAAGAAVLGSPITVQIFAPVDLSPLINDALSTVQLRRMQGGIDRNTGLASGLGRNYASFDSSDGVPPAGPALPYEMHFTTGFEGGTDPYTWIRLHNTPLVAPRVGSQGLPPTARLYGMEYVPSPIGADFSQDLATASWSSGQPKNTARWRIRLSKRLLASSLLGNQDHSLRVVTRIGTDMTSGVRWPEPNAPLNASETWAWWTRSPEAVPPTERAQFLGDPRHQPYLDCCELPGGGFPHAYNWHFDDLRALLADATPLWPCFSDDRLQDGFGIGVRADAPRFYELWREAVERCGAVWINPNGSAAEYLLLGGEIACSGTTAGVDIAPVWLAGAWLGASGNLALDTLTPPGLLTSRNGEQVLVAAATAWWCMPWLGETCPDERFESWLLAGNLRAGQFRWQSVSQGGLANLPAGTVIGPSGGQAGSAGPLMLVNCGDASACFAHGNTAANATPMAEAQVMATAMNVTLPPRLQAARPFSLNANSLMPPIAFQLADYPHTTANLMAADWALQTDSMSMSLFSGGSSWTASGSIAFGSGYQTRGFLVPVGMTPGVDQRSAIARQALMSGVRTLHLAGVPGQPGRVSEVVLPRFLDPRPGLVIENPGTVLLRWRTDWLRFDTQDYTSLHPVGFAESESDLVHRILISRDAGTSWTNALTRQPAELATFPASPNERLNDLAIGTETLALNMPADLYPAGEYLLLVESWSLTRQSHHGAHQVRVLVQRGR